MQYEVMIYWSPDDQAYVAEAPDLQYCAADGRTRSEALQNLQVVIGEWLATARRAWSTDPEGEREQEDRPLTPGSLMWVLAPHGQRIFNFAHAGCGARASFGDFSSLLVRNESLEVDFAVVDDDPHRRRSSCRKLLEQRVEVDRTIHRLAQPVIALRFRQYFDPVDDA